jgi:hypothetical protein
MDYSQQKEQLRRDGFVLIKELLTPDEVRHYVSCMEGLAGVRYGRNQTARGSMSKRGLDQSWYMPDGVTKEQAFWPLITNERLLTAVRQLLNPDIRYLQHSDLHVGFSAISWHRDSVCRSFGQGPDWDESAEPYQLVRVGIYLQSYAESHFSLGFIPGSHRPVEKVTFGRKISEARLKWLGALSYVSARFQEWASNATWIATEPGDCLIFDPRILHSGSYIVGPKYSIFLGYGLENSHFHNHHNYYRHIRTELNYQEPDPALVAQLQAADLYPEQLTTTDKIDHAWVPTPLIRKLVEQQRQKAANQAAQM